MKFINKVAICLGLTVLVSCAPRRSVSPQPSSWQDTLSVPPGTSLSDTDVQDIRILTIKEIRQPEAKLWIAGKGYAKLNGGSSVWFWQSSTPPQVEIEITDASRLTSCKAVVEQAKASGQIVSLSGNGHFDGKRINANLVGIFQITRVNSCELSQ